MDESQPTVEPRPIKGSPRPIPGRCGARLRRSIHKYGELRYCSQPPLHGHYRCKFHGGASLQGYAAPSFKHGYYSAVMPEHLLQDYTANRTDPERLSLRNEVALMRIKLAELIDKANKGQIATETLFKASARILKRHKELKAAQASKNIEALMRTLRRLDVDILVLGDALKPAWQTKDAQEAINSTAMVIGNLTKKENERGKMLHDMVAVDVVVTHQRALVGILLEVVDQNVADPETRREIRRATAHRYAELTGRRDPKALTP